MSVNIHTSESSKLITSRIYNIQDKDFQTFFVNSVIYKEVFDQYFSHSTRVPWFIIHRLVYSGHFRQLCYFLPYSPDIRQSSFGSEKVLTIYLLSSVMSSVASSGVGVRTASISGTAMYGTVSWCSDIRLSGRLLHNRERRHTEFDDRADSEKIENLLEQLAQKGFEGTAAETPYTAAETEAEELSAETETARHGENVGLTSESLGLTVAIPLNSVAVGNLTKLLDAKGNLIKKALGIDSLPIEIKEETVEFPWFGRLEPDEVKAYTHFISALCKLSKNAKRVTAKEKEVDNEKYAFRCFLLRLGFIGAEYKVERKILLRNLSGSSAFKAGRDGEQE